MERISLLHTRLQVTLVLVMLVLTLWGLINFLRQAGVGRYYEAGLSIGGLLAIAESLLGIPLLFGAEQPARLFLHIVYGIVAAAGLPAAYLYNRGRRGRAEALVYAGVSLFLLGIAIRAYETGAG